MMVSTGDVRRVVNMTCLNFSPLHLIHSLASEDYNISLSLILQELSASYQ